LKELDVYDSIGHLKQRKRQTCDGMCSMNTVSNYKRMVGSQEFAGCRKLMSNYFWMARRKVKAMEK